MSLKFIPAYFIYSLHLEITHFRFNYKNILALHAILADPISMQLV